MTTIFKKRRNDMVRGTQRKVIVVKDTKSGIFDEAYFIVKNSADSAHLTTSDMVSEADRIISNCAVSSYNNEKKESEKYLRPLWFFIGILCCDVFLAAVLALGSFYL